MLLQTSSQRKTYSFEVIPLSDTEHDKIFFFVQIIGGDSLLLKKRHPGGVWEKIRGGEFTNELQQAICNVIDNTSAAELWKDIMPLNEFDD
jgi:hypothetical protein